MRSAPNLALPTRKCDQPLREIRKREGEAIRSQPQANCQDAPAWVLRSLKSSDFQEYPDVGVREKLFRQFFRLKLLDSIARWLIFKSRPTDFSHPPTLQGNMTSHHAFKIHLTLFLVLSLFTANAFAQENVYESTDPAIGFNLVSYVHGDPDELLNYNTAIAEMASVNANHVNLVVFRKVLASGKFDLNSGPSLSTILKASSKAKSLGLKVTITPIFETESESGWRGAWNPTGTTRRNFRIAYARNLAALAKIAALSNADKLNIGSEMVAFVNEPINRRYMWGLINLSKRFFKGEIGYNANWDNFQSTAVEKILWAHPSITTMSVSMYPYHRLASVEEADQSHVNPQEFAENVKTRWRSMITDELLAYAKTRKKGLGMPLEIGEFGAVPFNRSAATPADFQPSEELDVAEQEAVIMGLIRSVDQMCTEIPEVTIWQWGIGDVSDRFGLNPFHDSPQQATALEITDFMQHCVEVELP